MSNCQDFKEEETVLRHLGQQLWVTVLLTLTLHAKLAGEGVEYSWAYAKALYRRLTVSENWGCDNFRQLMKESTSPANVLAKVRIEKFVLRARAYYIWLNVFARTITLKRRQTRRRDWMLSQLILLKSLPPAHQYYLIMMMSQTQSTRNYFTPRSIGSQTPSKGAGVS